MVLTLSVSAPAAEQERSVIPSCLQSRAPYSYEIRDEHDHRIAPTLAGYKLCRGQTYQLKVRTQEKSAGQWKLRILAPRSVIEVSGPDEVENDARVITFHTQAPPLGEWWTWFRSHVLQVPVHLDFEDGREPYRFHIPVVLRSSPLRRIGFFLLSAGASYVVDSVYRERFAAPSLTVLAVCFAVGAAAVVACFFLDQWSFYRQALRLMPAPKILPASNSIPGTEEQPGEA